MFEGTFCGNVILVSSYGRVSVLHPRTLKGHIRVAVSLEPCLWPGQRTMFAANMLRGLESSKISLWEWQRSGGRREEKAIGVRATDCLRRSSLIIRCYSLFQSERRNFVNSVTTC